jgi:hypothetical protein
MVAEWSHPPAKSMRAPRGRAIVISTCLSAAWLGAGIDVFLSLAFSLVTVSMAEMYPHRPRDYDRHQVYWKCATSVMALLGIVKV